MPFQHKHSGGNDGDDTDSLDAAEIVHNLTSIEAIPTYLLPDDSAARSALVLLAAAGYDCYAYASGGELTGTWCVWLGELARTREDRNGRVPATEWAEQWRDLLAQAYKGRHAVATDDGLDGGAQ
jgi:hypothetical protein